LGSTFFQNREFLFKLPQFRWNIVEQLNHVKIGKEFFEDDHLKFFHSIKDCLADTQPNIAIFSSVLQYLEKPYDVLSELIDSHCSHIIIDRTPFWNGNEDRLCIQYVPSSIFTASYPIWIFSRRRFLTSMGLNWNVVAQFVNVEEIGGPVEVEFRGFIVTPRTNSA
jgi:putative methyltransferase (TIGR04325 family)